MAEAVVISLLKILGAAAAAQPETWSFSRPVLDLEMSSSLNRPSAKDDINDIKRELESMLSFLRVADRVRNPNDTMATTWVKQVREEAYKAEDIIEELMYLAAGRKRDFIKNHRKMKDITKRLRKVKSSVRQVSERRRQLHFDESEVLCSLCFADEQARSRHQLELSSLVEHDVVGLEDSKLSFVEQLTGGNNYQRTVIAVLGMGGLGKTTLVGCVYNSPQVKKHFECAAWISISRDTEPMYFLRSAAMQLFKEDESDTDDDRAMDLPSLARKINNYLKQRRYVLVLDNVWNTEYARILIHAAFPDNDRGSRIVITTRLKSVASALAHHTHNLECLKRGDALTLLCKKAFLRPQNFTDDMHRWASKIIDKCDGLPLAIIAIGSLMLLHNMPEEWRRIHDSLNWNPINNQELNRVNRVLMSSFNELPYYLRHCFLYCSMFPEGSAIKCKRLIRLWVAEGLVEERPGQTMEEAAEFNLKELVFRSVLLVKDINESGRIKSCRVHDVVRELALSMAWDERFSVVCRGRQGSGTRWWCTDARRLSIHKTDPQFNPPPHPKMPNLRSFSVFEADTFSQLFRRGMPSLGFKLLRVLELCSTPIAVVPNEVFSLFNLRHLGLRDTKVKELSKSLKRLRNLQTLDILDTEIHSLPCKISKLQSLRHLFINNKIKAHKHRIMRFIIHGETLAGVWELKGLQTLKTVSCNAEIARKIGRLTQMRSLSIMGVRSAHGMDLCASITKMERLLSLCIIAAKEPIGEVLCLDFLSPPPQHLQKLILIGRMEGVPRWFSSLQNLTQLWLLDSHIEEAENLLHVIGKLPNLAYLVLDDAYKARELRFPARSFPTLKVLCVSKMLNLVSVVFLQGGMPELREFQLRSCVELKEPPKGVHYLTKLQQLSLVLMPEEFIEKIRRMDRSSSAFKHIVDVKHHSRGADGRWTVQLL